MELTPLEEFVKSVTSDVPLALDQPLTAFPVLQVKFFTKEDVGLNVLLFLFKRLVKVLHVLMSALTVSTKFQQLNALLVPSNAQLVREWPKTVPHVFMDQSQQTDHVQFNVDKTNSVSEDSVLPVHKVAMDAKSTLKIVSIVLLDMLKLDLPVKKDVFLINSMTEIKKDVLLVDLGVPHAQLTTIVPLARIPPSTLEVEFAQTVLILVPLVMELELALHVSVDSSTSKDHARPHVLMEPLQSTESVNVNQESSHLDNV